MKKVIAISIALVILLILMFLSLDQVQMMLPHLLLGWMDFIQRNIHQMRVRREVIWSVLLYAAILVVGGHYFARWLLRHLNGGLWKWSWSLRVFVLFLLMFIAGTSAVAVVRQTEWLGDSGPAEVFFLGWLRQPSADRAGPPPLRVHHWEKP